MKKYLLLPLLILFISSTSMKQAADDKVADVNGKWSGTIALVYDITVNMKQEEAKVNGLVNSEIGDIKLKDGVVTGNDVMFKQFTHNGMAVKFVKGKVEGDKMAVTVNFQGANFTGTLKRVK
ncbi:hypothetical protein [Mucilaginibacter myungsuensis]|uniref:Uncharacterized protein n=1 Tax=Mucilaginibacter myungsuensis TaxID=649104 RepID=A0A929L5M2_9SPHI|nr:hypothetical protein [Mucilaginibacter myungsuensis]MBE9663646.1 hypothetical protein [Mucilaginibacter myungsuensis]MDN3599030.1 hypothetical protein [Mucilaginibacter myungsuensis]